MKKSIWIGFSQGETLGEQLKNVADAGFEAVELNGCADVSERRDAARLLKASGLEPASVMTKNLPGAMASSPDENARKVAAQSWLNALYTAAEIGTDTVLAVPGRVSPEITYEDAMKYSRATVESVLPEAERLGVSLGIENVWNRFLLSPIEFAAYVDSFGSACVGAYFDVGNILFCGFPQHWIRTLGARIRRIHVKGYDVGSHEWTPLLQGSADWTEIMRALRDTGYDGYATAELEADERGLAGIAEDLSRIFTM